MPNPQPTSVPVITSAFEKPHLGLLHAAGTLNGTPVNMSFDDSALISFASTILVQRSGMKTLASSTRAANMRDRRTHNFASTVEPVNLKM